MYRARSWQELPDLFHQTLFSSSSSFVSSALVLSVSFLHWTTFLLIVDALVLSRLRFFSLLRPTQNQGKGGGAQILYLRGRVLSFIFLLPLLLFLPSPPPSPPPPLYSFSPYFGVLGPRRTGSSQVCVVHWLAALAFLSYGILFRVACCSDSQGVFLHKSGPKA